MRGMSVIVRTVTNLLYFFIFIFGFYIVMHGHLTPGGGFQGGAVLASAVAMIVVAYGVTQAQKFYKEGGLTSLESLGLVLFIGLAILGLLISSVFFYNFIAVNRGWPLFNEVPAGRGPGNLNTGGVIPLMNIAVGIEVIGGLGAIVYVMFRGGKK